VGNYVLITYGDGAVMGVPAHDERDFAFAKKYGLPIKQVVSLPLPRGEGGGEGFGALAALTPTLSPREREFSTQAWQDWYAIKGEGVAVSSGKYNGLKFQACVDAVAADLAAKNLGEKKTTWRLRDWGISRQRYWGTPIPIIHCDEHGAQPVPYEQLPVVLPEDCIPDGSGNPLHKHEGFHAGVKCPVCGRPARRETDTMDTFVDSSWYFIRYCLPEADQKASQVMTNSAVDYWMARGSAMDQYIGGIEHAILHLLYARFWTKVMRDMGLMQADEPFTKLLCQGMVLNHIYSRRTAKGGKEYLWPHDVEHTHDEAGKITGAKLKHAVDYTEQPLPAGTPIDYEGVGTMSKSKNNGVDPQALINKYGADTARLYTMFTAPPEATLEWNDSAVEGSYRFLRRVWQFAAKHHSAITQTMQAGCGQAVQYSAAGKALRFEMYGALKQANYDYERMQYNTVVSAAMKMLNALEAAKLTDSYDDRAVLTECFSLLLSVLYPACPHISAALWQEMGYANAVGDILDAPWPQDDAAALVQDEVELMLQINGKLRGSIKVAADAAKDAIEKAALSSEAFTKQANGATPKKVIVVPGRLVNVVL
jgi:leucyl-tRNA synthetase